MKISLCIGRSSNVGNPTYQYFAMISGTLSVLISGMHFGWPSPSLPRLTDVNSHIPVTSDEGSWLAIMSMLFELPAGFAAALLCKIFSGKQMVLLAAIPFAISWIMIALSNSVAQLYIARAVVGMADAMTFCSFPGYLGEISDARIRGRLGSFSSVTFVVGFLVIQLIGSFFDITATALISTTFPLLLVMTFIWMPESPYHLIKKQKYEQAERSLQIFRGVDDVEEEYNRIYIAVRNDNAPAVTFWNLFTVPSNRKALFITIILRTAQQLSGASVITFYVQTIFGETSDVISSEHVSIIYFSVQVIVASFASMIVDKTGRRPLLIFSITSSTIALFVEALYFYFKESTNIDVSHLWCVPVVAMLAYVITFSVGMQTLPSAMLTELFPTNVKGFALAFAETYYCIIASIASKFFQLFKDNFGMHIPFFAFTLSCVLGLVFIVLFVPETKGKTLEEIQLELKAERGSRQLPHTHAPKRKP